jgi:hypothetical protein
MLKQMGLSMDQQNEAIEFIDKNIGVLREPSVRTARKLGMLILAGDDWKTTAKHTLMKSK